VADDLKLKGPVKEIGVARDSERHDSFNITIGIAIKTDGRVSYEEAERLSSKFRREYLGKDVEFVAVSIPCPICGKIMNSESGLKKHIAMNHPEKAELINPLKVAARDEKAEKKERRRKSEKLNEVGKTRRKRAAKAVKPVKAGKTTKVEKPKTRKEKVTVKVEKPEEAKPRIRGESKPAPITRSTRLPSGKRQPKSRQMTLT
jgi:hypothetical protein